MSDFTKKIGFMADKIKTLTNDFEKLKTDYEAAKEFTPLFLDECKKAGITKVAICKKHKSVPSSDFTFGVNGSVFAYQPKGVRKNSTFPPIWGVCSRMQVSNGCGNPDQHQIKSEKLIDGVYHLRKGIWHKIDD